MNELKLKKLVNAVAYFAVIFLAVALLLSQISSAGSLLGDISNIFARVANAIAYFIVAVMAFFYIRIKRNIIYMITYIVSIILIVIFVILPIF